MATLEQRLVDALTRVATEFKTVRAATGDNVNLTTAVKSTLVGAINEVKAATASASGINDSAVSSSTTYSSIKINALNAATAATIPLIDDAAAATTKLYSSSKVTALINAAVSALIASSPAALDTLNELAAALGNDANFATTTATALGFRVRYDAAQTLTGAQQTQMQTNTGTAAASLFGNTDRDLVAVFTTALV